MTAATLTAPVETTTTTTAQPLTDREADALLIAAAGLEKTSKVRAGSPLRSSEPAPRAWSRGGNVD